MKNKNYLILTLALAVGALAVLLFKPGVHETVDTLVGETVFKESDAPTISKMQILKGADKLELEKNNESMWRITSDQNFPADASKIANFLDNLGKSKYQRTIEDAKKSLGDFGLETPTLITLFADNKEVLKINLGTARAGGGQYISKPEKPNTAYLINEQLHADFTPEAWENKVLFDLKAEAVKKVEFWGKTKGAKPLALVSREKKEDKLTLADTTPKDKVLLDAIDGVAQILSQVRYQRRINLTNEEAKTAMKTPFLTSVYTFDDQRLDIMTGSIGEKDKQKFYVKIVPTTPNRPDLLLLNELMGGWFFEFSSYDANKFQKVRKDFFNSGAKT